MGTTGGICACREEQCWAARSYDAARPVKLEWASPHGGDVTAIYTEAIIERTVPGTQFVPISFRGGYLGLQDSPEIDGHQRIIFCVDNLAMMLPPASLSRKRTAMVCETSPAPRTPPRGEPDCEPNAGESPATTHFIGTPGKGTTVTGNDDLMTTSPSTPVHYAGESNVQVLHFGRHVNVCQSAEAIHFRDDTSTWEIGQKLRFLVVHAGIPRSQTCYAAYVDVGQDWQHHASVSVACGKGFDEHCSCIEDLRRDGASPHEERRAQFGPVWFRLSNGSWQLTKKATFMAGKAEGRNQTSVYTTAVPGTGRRILATGGPPKDKDNSADSKIGTERTVAAPTDKRLPDAPDFPQWFSEMARTA